MRHFKCLMPLALSSACLDLQAADLNARDFVSAPSGTTVGVAYLPVTRAHEYHGPGDVNGKARLAVDAFAYRQLWFTDVCGTLCTPQFIVPYASIKTRGPGSTITQEDRGMGDPQIGGTLFFIDEPESRTYSGLLTMLTLPIGEYDQNNPEASPGSNRWALNLNYNYTKGLGTNWIVEGNLEVHLYGKNRDYRQSELEQRPLYRAQMFASYDFTPSSYGALRLIHAQGGELEIDGQTLADSRQRYTQVGLEAGHWIDRRNQLLLGVTRNVSAQNTFASDNILLRFVHVF
jgi:hypothetical protein